jgi:ABC-type transporter MlaC component
MRNADSLSLRMRLSTLFLIGVFLSVSGVLGQSLSTGRSGGLSTGGSTLNAKLTPVPGSAILSTAYVVKPDSASAFLTQEIVRLEKMLSGESSSKLKAQEAKVRALISSTLDLERLAERSLAGHWVELGKSAQGRQRREKYRKLFRQLVEENYIEKARTYVTGKYQIPLLSESVQGDRVIILGEIKKTDVNLRVEFHLMASGAKGDKLSGKGFRVVDVKLDETSLEATYRSSFNRIIRKQGGLAAGFPELLNVMERRLTELKKGVATRL